MTKTQKGATTAFVAVLIMFASNGLSRILGFAREILLAALFGTGQEAAAYTYSFLLPEMLNHFLAGSALAIAFIPLFQELEDTPHERDRFFSNILTLGTLIFSVTIVILIILTPQLMIGKNIHANKETLDLTIFLTRIILPAQLFFFIGALLNGVQYAQKRFLLPALTPLFYNLGIILCGILLYSSLGIAGFAWGVLIGAFVGNVGTQIYGVSQCGIRYRPHINLKDPLLHRWFFMTVPLMLGLGLTFSNEVTFRLFGATSPDGAQAIPALNYAFKIIMVFVGLFGLSIAGGIFPFLSQSAKEKDYAQMENLVIKALSLSLTLGVLFVALSYPLAQRIIEITFQRGQFTPQDTFYTATVFTAYLPGTLFFIAVLVLNRLFFAIKKTVTPLVISTISLVVTLPLYYFWGEIWGASGIPLASGVFSLITVAGLLIYWKKWYPESTLTSRLRTPLIKSLGIGFLVLLVTTWIESRIPLHSFTAPIPLLLTIHLIEVTTPGTILALVAFHFSGVLTFQELKKNLFRKKKRA